VFGGVLLLAVVVFVVGGSIIAGGYWVSDRAYDAGLWPIGALLRIALLLSLVSWAFGLLMLLFAAFASLFSRGES
jgi:hypothetical protein